MHRSQPTLATLSLLTGCLTATAAQAGSASEWPGKYTSEEISVEIVAATETTFTGVITMGEHRFPLEARTDAGRLLGTFKNGDDAFAFTATRTGNEFKLLTGGVNFTLKGQAPPPVNPLVQTSKAPVSRPAAAPDIKADKTPRPSTRPLTRPAQVHTANSAPARVQAAASSPGSSSDTVILVRTDVFDPMIGCNAFSLLVPNGWKVEGGIGWRQHPFFPAFANMRIGDPNSPAAVTLYPMLHFNDGIREVSMRQAGYLGPEAAQFMGNSFPEGGNYMGAEVRRRVAGPAEYVTQFIIPRFRRDLTGARVTAVKDLPEYANAKAAAGEYDQVQGSQWRAAQVRITSQVNGRSIEEDFVCFMWSVPMLGMYSWGAECESYRAAAGRLDAMLPLFQAVDRSIKLDVRWYNAHAQVAQMIQQNIRQAGQQAVELSRYISRVNDQISDIIRSSYENTQRTMDRCHEKFSNYIRGVETYQNPFKDHPLEVPSGYDRVFSNPLGEVILTNDGLFDPGTVSNQDWRELQPVP